MGGVIYIYYLSIYTLLLSVQLVWKMILTPTKTYLRVFCSESINFCIECGKDLSNAIHDGDYSTAL
jgi:hypothetical protein